MNGVNVTGARTWEISEVSWVREEGSSGQLSRCKAGVMVQGRWCGPVQQKPL